MLIPVKWPYLIGLIILFGASFYLFYPKIEDFFVFYPDKSFALTPEALKLKYEDVYFNTGDGKGLHGWFFPLEGGGPVILFCHGNAGNISHRLDNIRILLQQGLQVFIFDYRGFGKSTGRPSEKGIYRDGLAAYDYLIGKGHLPPDRIILFGRSLGAAVAIEVALRKNAGAIIIESAFTSTKDMAKTMFLFGLFSYFLPANYNNLEKIARCDIPKLIIHGQNDEIVPFSMGKKLFAAAKGPKYFLPLEKAGHVDAYSVGGEKYLQTIAGFIRESKIRTP